MSSVVEVMVQAFQEAGTPFIAGLPGEEGSLDIIEAADKRGMRFILAKHETAGAFLAAAWGEITGAPGVFLSTRGPGAANMVNGVLQAYLDRCPMIAITDQYSAPAYSAGTHMRLDQLALFQPITKWNSSINAQSARQQIRRAIRAAVGHPPGPVQLDLPNSEKTSEAAPYDTDAPLIPNIVDIVPEQSALKVPLQMLKKSRRPILLVGAGILWSDACSELISFAERLGAPVLTTAKSKGSIPEDHRLSAGCLRGGAMERKLVSGADLIVAVGLDPVELQPAPWPYSIPVLALSSTPGASGEVPAAAEVVGNLKGILEGLSKWGPDGSGWSEHTARAYRDEMAAMLNVPGRGLSPHRLFEVARSVLPRDTIATTDTGASRTIGGYKWLSYAPKEFIVSSGLTTMGYAVPAALAARLAHPKRPVVAFSGDGGFLMVAGELQTAVREKLPITVVVLSDGELGAMRIRQDLRGLSRLGTQLGNFNWERLAEGYGADGIVVETENALGDALTKSVESDGTTLIVARIDASNNVDQFKAMWGNLR